MGVTAKEQGESYKGKKWKTWKENRRAEGNRILLVLWKSKSNSPCFFPGTAAGVPQAKTVKHNLRHAKSRATIVGGGAAASLGGTSRFTGLYTGPYFDQSTSLNPANVTAELGRTARLPCKVKQLGGKTVSTKSQSQRSF
jgi:hypothetical protein